MQYIDWLNKHCKSKLVGAEQAMAQFRGGSRVFIGTGCGEPQHLIRAMVADQTKQDITIYQMLSATLAQFVEDPMFCQRFALKLFFNICIRNRKIVFDIVVDEFRTNLLFESKPAYQYQTEFCGFYQKQRGFTSFVGDI